MVEAVVQNWLSEQNFIKKSPEPKTQYADAGLK